MADTKEALKRDLVNILKLSHSYDMSDKNNLIKIEKFLREKTLFHTSMGTVYRNRIHKLIEGENEIACMLCKKEKAQDGIVCQACMAKYTGNRFTVKGNISKHSTNIKSQEMLQQKIQTIVHSVPIPSNLNNDEIKENLNGLKENAKAISKDAAKKTGKMLREVNEKNDITGKSKRLIRRLYEIWKRQNRKTKIIVIAVAIVCVMGLFVGGNVGSETGSVNNDKQAYKLVNKEFSTKDDWSIKYIGTTNLAAGSFWGEVGESAKLSEKKATDSGDEKMINKYYTMEECFVFQIQKKDLVNGVQTAQVYVNPNGKINAVGKVVGFPSSTVAYRIK